MRLFFHSVLKFCGIWRLFCGITVFRAPSVPLRRLCCILLKNLVHSLFKFVSGAMIFHTVCELSRVLKITAVVRLSRFITYCLLPYSQQALRGANVQGTQNVLLFACTSKIKPFHYIRYAKILYETFFTQMNSYQEE